MLDPETVDLGDLALALEDHSPGHSWWIDSTTGEVNPSFSEDADDGLAHPGPELLPVEPLPSSVGYGDMEDFAAHVRDPRARDMLERAIGGRGAFRRFKDALLDYPDLRRAWFSFHDARGERRAIEWLQERGLADRALAEQALARRPEPEPDNLPGLLDAHGVARRVTGDLRRLYRDRLRGVIMLGPWARGDAHPESEVELLVVLDEVPDRWEEKRRMDRVMWRHSVRNDTVLTEVPVAEGELEGAATPFLERAIEEGVRVE